MCAKRMQKFLDTPTSVYHAPYLTTYCTALRGTEPLPLELLQTAHARVFTSKLCPMHYLALDVHDLAIDW